MSVRLKKWGLVTAMAGAFAAIVAVAVVAGGIVLAAKPALAQGSEPTPSPSSEKGDWGWFGWGSGSWKQFDTIAEALGLTPNELFAQLHDEGKSVSQIADEKGIDIQTVRDALNASRVEAQRQAIEQAVQDGKMSQEQADWLLEGLDKGFYGGGRGMGRGGHMGMGSGRGWFGPCAPSTEEG
jgi:lambda repressor-like predicted transcriptional regulator